MSSDKRSDSEVTHDLLKRLDMKVNFAAVDWGTVVARRAQKTPPDQGGWHMYHTGYYGTDCIDPTNRFIRASGDLAVNGWANNPQVEAEVAAWYGAKTLDEEKAAVRRLNKAALDNVIFAPLGVYTRHFAWRKTVSGVAQGPPLPLFWGVSKVA
jgi:peptide/nickel transport system substrate-binding protein